MHHHPRWVRRLGRNPDRAELSGRSVKMERVDTFAARLRGVRADVGEVLAFGRSLPGSLRRRKKQRRRQHNQKRNTSSFDFHEAENSITIDACCAPLAEAYFLSSSFSSCKTAAAATESSSSSRSRRTPCVERPASRISFA